MKKLLTLLASVLILIGLSSSAFYVIKNGEKKKVGVGSQGKNKPSSGGSKFLPLSGGKMKGGIDMSGFGLTGLPRPDSASDAATKEYVDSLSFNGSGGNQTPGLSDVLGESNVALGSIGFANGVMLGTGSLAEPYSVALGRNANALKRNSVAIGMGSKVNRTGTVKLGSESRPLDLNVTGNATVQGDLEVKGELKGAGSSPDVLTDSIAVDSNGTYYSLPERFDSIYTVSATPVGSLADVGVFNKTSSGFRLESSEFTRVDLAVFN